MRDARIVSFENMIGFRSGFDEDELTAPFMEDYPECEDPQFKGKERGRKEAPNKKSFNDMAPGKK